MFPLYLLATDLSIKGPITLKIAALYTSISNEIPFLRESIILLSRYDIAGHVKSHGTMRFTGFYIFDFNCRKQTGNSGKT